MSNKLGVIIVVLAVLAIILAGTFIRLYTDWLWFESLDFSVVFSKVLLTKIGLGVTTGIAFLLFMYANLWLARRLAPPSVIIGTSNPLTMRLGSLARNGMGLLALIVSVVVAVLVGMAASASYMDWLYWVNSVPFGEADPVLGVDISFYLFKMGFVQFLYSRLLQLLVLSLAATALLYYASDAISAKNGQLYIIGKARKHLGVLTALLFFCLALGYRLTMFKLLYGERAQFDGPGYASIHAELPGLWAMMALAVLAGIVCFAAIQRNRTVWVWGAVIVQILAAFVLQGIYPGLVQTLVVKPNQLQKEMPYIARNIDATQKAYGLDKVATRSFPTDTTLTPEQIADNASTIENTRLWDADHISVVYSVMQTIQQYYHFNQADVDRYWIGRPGEPKHYRQVWLAARELSQDSLPPQSQTWINKRLRYTHGYGLAMSPINEVGNEGLPNYFISDIPPKTPMDIKLDRMGIYFGEMTDDYVFVGTSLEEFDYPTADKTITSRHEAKTGIPIGSFMRKLLFAVKFSDINILLNTNLESGSKLLYRRNITERLNHLFPYLSLDPDPYLVVADGGLHWMVDAFTTSERYPYSHPVRAGYTKINYIRNSVKITVDAYSGDVNAYIIEKPHTDPMARVYAKMFPGVFKDISEMPQSLREHVRYPEALFKVQNFIFETYHMSDPSVFYQRSDQWTIPSTAQLEGSAAEGSMEPYYTIMRLPDTETEEFILMTIFKRKAKTNMVAWMCAKCDEADYGKLLLYEFADDRNVPGPDQVIARTNQDTYISQQLSLWSQGTSRVGSGNLLVMPIDTSLLYVMPLYLESSTTKIPEMKMIIAALGDKLVMEPTLQRALTSLVGENVKLVEPVAQSASPSGKQPVKPPSAGLEESFKKALGAYQRSQEALRSGNWTEYGKEQAELGRTLEEIKSKLAK